MNKYLSIDPGKYKCGIVLTDFDEKKICLAEIIKSNLLIDNIKNLKKKYSEMKVIIGNGTTSKEHIENLYFLGDDLTIAEEKNTTLRAKKRYFELFPKKGLKRFIPDEILIININLDAIAALIILEDFLQFKFNLTANLRAKTWRIR